MNSTVTGDLSSQMEVHNAQISSVVLNDIYLFLTFLYVGAAGLTALLIQIIGFHCSQRKTARMMRA
jgi:hypothetical protein